MLVVYHIKIFSLAREKREREVKICGVHFDRISLLYSYFKSHMLFRHDGRRFWSVPYCFYTESKLKHFLILNLVTKRCFDFILREFHIIQQLDDERSLSTL